MASKADLVDWLVAALTELGGAGTIVQAAKIIWRDHRGDLERSGALFFTWQYDMRWAANNLRRNKLMKPAEVSPKGRWELL
jgi:hypothetical protein